MVMDAAGDECDCRAHAGIDLCSWAFRDAPACDPIPPERAGINPTLVFDPTCLTEFPPHARGKAPSTDVPTPSAPLPPRGGGRQPTVQWCFSGNRSPHPGAGGGPRQTADGAKTQRTPRTRGGKPSTRRPSSLTPSDAPRARGSTPHGFRRTDKGHSGCPAPAGITTGRTPSRNTRKAARKPRNGSERARQRTA